MASSNSYPQKNQNQPNQITSKYNKHSSSNEKALVYEALSHITFLNRRSLSEVTGLEISVLCRVLNHLVYDLKTVKIAFSARCSTTKKKVMYFTLMEGASDGN